MSETVGVVVLCAKQEEVAVVKANFDERFSKVDSFDSFYQYQLPPGRSGTEELLMLGSCSGMGNILAASRTGYIIGTIEPNLILFVGTAAALDHNELSVGDVFIPQGYSSRYFDKMIEVGNQGYDELRRKHGLAESFFPRLRSKMFGLFNRILFDFQTRDENITSVAARHVTSAIVASKASLESRLRGWPHGTRPAKIVSEGSIFSWDLIINSPSYREFLLSSLSRKVYAVDMESFGFLESIKAFTESDNKVANGIVVRGISDLAGRKAESFSAGSSAIALGNAAAVAAEIILKGYLES